MLNQNEDKNKGETLEALRHKAVDFARRASREHVQRAKAEVAILKDREGKEALLALADFALERET